MQTASTRAQILAAKRADSALAPAGEPLTPGGERERKRALYRRPGVTGTYVERASRKPQVSGAAEPPPPDRVWTWYARDTAFRGKTVGEWREEASDPLGRLDAKYMLLRGADDDPIVRGSREEVLTGAAHVTNTSAKLMYTDLRRHKSGKVISARKSASAQRQNRDSRAASLALDTAAVKTSGR